MEPRPTEGAESNDADGAALQSLCGGGGGGGRASDAEGCRKVLEELATAEAPTSKDELYARLCGIFEEEKVKFVMNSHPNEISPQKICSLILTYFPSP